MISGEIQQTRRADDQDRRKVVSIVVRLANNLIQAVSSANEETI